MRTELAALLRLHRVQHRLGAPSPHARPGTSTRTDAERAQLGLQIRQYRQTILTWSAAALHAATPLTFSASVPPPANPFLAFRENGPVLELARTIDYTREQSTAPLATLELLTTPSDNPLVEHWRQAARAAALAEHDTGGPEFTGRLTAAQAKALAGDIAAISQALIVLDQRYSNTPGWEHLAQPHQLGWAALACALDVSLGQPDYSLDKGGWQPRLRTIRGPAKPGVLGVLQAEHNLLVRLQTYPNVLNLRRIVDSQRLVSALLVPLAGRIDESLGKRWAERAVTYAEVQRQLRNVGGLVGRGELAVAEAANAVSRLRALPQDTIVEPRVLAAFQTLFTKVDERIADIVEVGIERQLFQQRVSAPQVDDEADQLVHHLQTMFVPVTRTADLQVYATVRDRLRPKQTDAAPRGPGRSRADLHTALIHRSDVRGTASRGPSL